MSDTDMYESDATYNGAQIVGPGPMQLQVDIWKILEDFQSKYQKNISNKWVEVRSDGMQVEVQLQFTLH
ncbi:hypothetical protein AAE478_002753 [Parahypoxylon ruwenzoriense]